MKKWLIEKMTNCCSHRTITMPCLSESKILQSPIWNSALSLVLKRSFSAGISGCVSSASFCLILDQNHWALHCRKAQATFLRFGFWGVLVFGGGLFVFFCCFLVCFKKRLHSLEARQAGYQTERLNGSGS